jgi:uncharacterized protein YciI
MEFLTINRPHPGADSEQLTAVIPAHLRWVDRGLRTGDLVRAGRWGRGGMCIIEAPDEAAATRVLREDPLVIAGLVDVEIAAIVAAGPPGAP